MAGFRSTLSHWLPGRVARLVCNFHVTFILAMTVAVQILWLDFDELVPSPLRRHCRQHVGDSIFYGKEDLHVNYVTYADGVFQRLVGRAGNASDVTICDGAAYELHDVGRMPILEAGLFQTLGDTKIHVVRAVVDDRITDRKFLRVLGVGLHPGSQSETFCGYACLQSPANRCSSAASGVILLAGNHTEYDQAWNRKSHMNVMMFTCPLKATHDIQEMTLTSSQCGYSHNKIPVQRIDTTGVAAPPWELGVCLRPINESRLADAMFTDSGLARWLEYHRLLGIDHVHVYIAQVSARTRATLSKYSTEPRSFISTRDWAIMENHVEIPVSEEAAVNDCIYENMMKYRYILVTSVDQWVTPRGGFGDMKQLIRGKPFRDSISKYSGFRLFTTGGKPAMIVKSRLVLAAAANHFIPMTSEPSFTVLDDNDVISWHFFQMQNSETYRKLSTDVDKMVRDKLIKV